MKFFLPCLSTVLGWGETHIFFELPHVMQRIFISAESRYRADVHVCFHQIKAAVFQAGLDQISMGRKTKKILI